jgi:hypothetical protein
MIYLIYILLVPISLLLTLIAIILAPVFPIFATEQEGWLDNHSRWGMGPRLPSWLGWFMTPDNSLDGDATFEKLNPPCYWSQVKWLWRNPCYSFAIRYLMPPYNASYKGDNSIKDMTMRKQAGAWFTLTDYFNLLLLFPLALVGALWLILVGMSALLWILMSTLNQIRTKRRSYFHLG